jgi:hypothetical protein
MAASGQNQMSLDSRSNKQAKGRVGGIPQWDLTDAVKRETHSGRADAIN